MWFFILGGLIAFTGKTASSPCPVDMRPTRAAVRYRDPFSANCSSSSNQTASMGWESSNGGVSLTHGVSFLPLNIESVTDWELAPMCYVNLHNDYQCEEVLPVIVYKTPDSVSMSLQNQAGPMIEGTKFNVLCSVVGVAPVGNLSVHLHIGNMIYHTKKFDKTTATPEDKSTPIDVVAHRDHHGVEIWCEAKLDFWPAGPNIPSTRSESQELIVLYPPTFANPENETLVLPAGSKITLNCTAEGNPTPAYSWQFPHSIQQTDESQNANQPILTPSFELTGTYGCIASNAHGTKTKYFTVTEAERDHTTFAVLVGVFVALGFALLVAGYFFVRPDGTFSFSKDSYQRGQPTSSGPV